MKPPLHITSAQNPRLKSTADLRERKAREKTGHILIEGQREIMRALESGLRPVELYTRDDLADSELLDLSKRVITAGATHLLVSPHAFDKLAIREGSTGLVAIFERPSTTLDTLRTSLPTKRAPLLLALSGVEKPGNLGALLRSADSAGVDAVFVLEGSSDLYAPQAIRTSLGTIFSRPTLALDSDTFESFCAQQGIQIILAALTKRSLRPWDIDFRKPSCLVLGSEAFGLDARWLNSAHPAMEIPMQGRADSLNVAAAGAIGLYEASRQRLT